MTASRKGKLLVATRSVGKMREIRRILADVPGLEVLSLDDAGIAEAPEEEGLEPHDTFEENARSKAAYFFGKTGIPTVADDSGIVVDALQGAPGVRSKRFAPPELVEGLGQDEANNAYLVERLKSVAAEHRTARYVCVAVMLDGRTGETEIVTRGSAEGRVVAEPRGEGGFGYDPHVLVPELGRTFAELSAEEKDARSHRGEAFRALAARLLQRADDARG